MTKTQKLIAVAILLIASMFFLTKAWAAAHTTIGSWSSAHGVRKFTPFDYKDGADALGYFGTSWGGNSAFARSSVTSLESEAEKYRGLTFLYGFLATMCCLSLIPVCWSSDPPQCPCCDAAVSPHMIKCPCCGYDLSPS